MATILGLLSNSTFLSLALALIDFFIAQKGASAETRQALQQIATFLQQNGVARARVAYSAEQQIAQGDQMWTDLETKAKGDKNGQS